MISRNKVVGCRLFRCRAEFGLSSESRVSFCSVSCSIFFNQFFHVCVFDFVILLAGNCCIFVEINENEATAEEKIHREICSMHLSYMLSY